MATAHASAASGLSKLTKKPSPGLSISSPRWARCAVAELPRQQLFNLYDDDCLGWTRESRRPQQLLVDALCINDVRLEELPLQPVEHRRREIDARSSTDAPLTLDARAQH